MSNGRPWPCGQPCGIEPGGQLGGCGGGAEPFDQLDAGDGLRRAVPGWTGLSTVSSSVAPVCQRIPIRDLAGVGLGQHGDVGDQGAEQPFAVPGAGGRRVPEAGQVSGEFLQLSPARQGRQRVLGGLQRLLGFSQCGEPGLPAGFQGAGDQPVLRLDLAERALGAVGVVAGTLDGELGGPADALAAARHLVGRGQRQGDLTGGERVQQRTRDSVIDAGCGDGRQDGVVSRSGRELHS